MSDPVRLHSSRLQFYGNSTLGIIFSTYAPLPPESPSDHALASHRSFCFLSSFFVNALLANGVPGVETVPHDGL